VFCVCDERWMETMKSGKGLRRGERKKVYNMRRVMESGDPPALRHQKKRLRGNKKKWNAHHQVLCPLLLQRDTNDLIRTTRQIRRFSDYTYFEGISATKAKEERVHVSIHQHLRTDLSGATQTASLPEH